MTTVTCASTITELALEANAPISTGDFRTLNRCLDQAIAAAVTMYMRERSPAPWRYAFVAALIVSSSRSTTNAAGFQEPPLPATSFCRARGGNSRGKEK